MTRVHAFRSHVGRVRVRVGYYAVPDFAQANVDAVEMLVRAASALRQSVARGSDAAIQAFSEVRETIGTAAVAGER